MKHEIGKIKYSSVFSQIPRQNRAAMEQKAEGIIKKVQHTDETKNLAACSEILQATIPYTKLQSCAS